MDRKTTFPPSPEPPILSGYGGVVAGLASGSPLAYWRSLSGGVLTDIMVGARHGTVTGAAVATASLPTQSDDAVDFGGVSEAEVAHDAGLVLSAFTLSGWVKFGSLPDPGDNAMAILTKNNAVVTARDWVLYVPSGTKLPRALPRRCARVDRVDRRD